MDTTRFLTFCAQGRDNRITTGFTEAYWRSGSGVQVDAVCPAA